MSHIPSILTAEQMSTYADEGILILDIPESLVELENMYFEEVADFLNIMGGIQVKPNEVPVMLPKIAVDNRTLIGRLYKVSRRFLSVKRIAVDKWLSDISKQLMNTPLVSACHFVNIRIDLPGEEKYLLPAHQDFPYIQGSLNALTWWIPFLDTPLEMGPPSWVTGSHKDGIQKVKYFDYEATGQSGGRSFELVDQTKYDDASFTRKPVMKGQCLVFHTALIHRSEINHTNIARTNLQVRFDDATAQESFERNYPEGLYLGDQFSKHYPQYTL
jgi:hypothetical protein